MDVIINMVLTDKQIRFLKAYFAKTDHSEKHVEITFNGKSLQHRHIPKTDKQKRKNEIDKQDIMNDAKRDGLPKGYKDDDGI